MRILVDGDATPDREGIKEIAMRYGVEMIVFCDYAHLIEDDYFTTIQCEVGKDKVDMMLYGYANADDIAITQDYGLAALLLSKHVDVLHVSGKRITDHNIERLLDSRYLGYQERKRHRHVHGPHKRTNKERYNLLEQVERLIIEHKFPMSKT